LETLKNQ